ncbi:MAG: lysylphosphatidylglycerol synthase transmembrane domain-containing protein [Ilumatobacteraceae bacterium]|nr:lysylphosphatidylglycerol synthase transmembrane domain-containing protein [Ilumatobacteraceae bacterium]
MLGWLPTGLRWAFAALVVGLVVWWFVLPQFDEAEDALDLVADVDPLRVVAAGVLVVAAFVAQAQMVRTVLPRHETPRLFDVVRIELAAAAVSHTVPGGTAAGTALGYRLLTDSGVDGTSAGFAVAVRGVGSSVVLNVALGSALAVWIPMNGFHANFGVAATVGAVALGAVGLLTAAVTRSAARLVDTITRIAGAIPGVEKDEVGPPVDRFVQQVRELVSDRPLALHVGGWAAAHWLAEAAALWIMLGAFGWSGSPLAIFIAFGVVNVIAAVPITPRGLGIVEAVLIPMLVALGAPGQVAALGVLAWRLLSFWAPIPVGTIGYLSLRIAEPRVGDEDMSGARRRTIRELATARRPPTTTVDEATDTES